jgi:hypothetical protein
MAQFLNPLDVADLTESGLFRFLKYDVGVPVTASLIHTAVMRREIIPTRLGRRNMFSRRDGLNWLAAQKEKGKPKQSVELG